MMSAPAMKVFSPAPVTTIARTEASASSASKACANSLRVFALSAFITLGRLIVTMAMPAVFSTSRFS